MARDEPFGSYNIDSWDYYPDKPNRPRKKDTRHTNRQSKPAIEELKEAIKKKPVDTLFKIIIYVIGGTLGIAVAIKIALNIIW